MVLLLSVTAQAQVFAVAAERNNTFYTLVDNPVAIAVHNTAPKDLIVRTNNGRISGANGQYTFHTLTPGSTDIILYKRSNGKLKEIGRAAFRVREFPDPVPKIGPSGGGSIQRRVLAAQDYIRAEFEGFDINARLTIDSFTVCIFRGDTCVLKEYKNSRNKIEEPLSAMFQSLREGDTVVFKQIFAVLPDGKQRQLAPFVLFIKE